MLTTTEARNETMTSAAKTHAIVVARMRDGTIAFESRLRTGDMLVRRRSLAWVMTPDEAEEHAQRFHQVQALGHYHRDVLFYEPVRVKLPRKRR
jgi:hypothetical protein